MASLHKHPRSPHWQAAYTDANGRRRYRSTRTRNRTLAMRIALEWETAAKAGRQGRLIETQVRRVLSEIVEQATGTGLANHTTAEWFTEWLSGKRATTSKATLAKYEATAKAFLRSLGPRANLPIAAVTVKDVRTWRDTLSAAGRTPRTVNGLVAKVLSAPFEAARRQGYLTANPCAGVPPLKDKAAAEKGTFTPEQIAQLLKTAPNDWQGMIIAAVSTGLRLMDLANLTWAAIDRQAQIIDLRTRKTGSRVTIPIAPTLAQWLAENPGIGNAPVFPSLHGKSGPGKSGLSMAFARIVKDAKINPMRTREATGPSGRNAHALTFHALRHTFISRLATAGVPADVRKRLAGHATDTAHAIYTHHELDTLRAAIATLPPVRAAGQRAGG